EFMGPALPWRRGLFLADANAANLPFDHPSGALRHLRERFPAKPCDFDRAASFLDTFTANRRSVPAWAALPALGLEVLYLGVETGNLQLLRMLRKPGHPERVADLVGRLKQAGLRVGVILMTGVGGRALAQRHVEDSAALLNRLPLDGQDRVYLSE